jgi:hypothetical protein
MSGIRCVFFLEVPRVASVSERQCGTVWQGNRINKLHVGESAPEAGTIYLYLSYTLKEDAQLF